MSLDDDELVVPSIEFRFPDGPPVVFKGCKSYKWYKFFDALSLSERIHLDYRAITSFPYNQKVMAMVMDLEYVCHDMSWVEFCTSIELATFFALKAGYNTLVCGWQTKIATKYNQNDSIQDWVVVSQWLSDPGSVLKVESLVPGCEPPQDKGEVYAFMYNNKSRANPTDDVRTIAVCGKQSALARHHATRLLRQTRLHEWVEHAPIPVDEAFSPIPAIDLTVKSQHWLKDVDFPWQNVIQAGGSVVSQYHNCTSDDVDLFVYGPDVDASAECIRRLLHFFERWFTKKGIKLLYTSKSSVLSIYPFGQGYHIQVVVTPYMYPYDLVDEFDFDYVKAYYDGQRTYCTALCALAWQTKVISFTKYTETDVYMARVWKSTQKGFRLSDRVSRLFHGLLASNNLDAQLFATTHEPAVAYLYRHFHPQKDESVPRARRIISRLQDLPLSSCTESAEAVLQIGHSEPFADVDYNLIYKGPAMSCPLACFLAKVKYEFDRGIHCINFVLNREHAAYKITTPTLNISGIYRRPSTSIYKFFTRALLDRHAPSWQRLLELNSITQHIMPAVPPSHQKWIDQQIDLFPESELMKLNFHVNDKTVIKDMKQMVSMSAEELEEQRDVDRTKCVEEQRDMDCRKCVVVAQLRRVWLSKDEKRMVPCLYAQVVYLY